MRAAMTYAFGRLYGCGNRSWQLDESRGVMVGNPSISDEVSNYMLALRRRKVRKNFLNFFYLSDLTPCW
jgi:hypothetical protein